MLESVFAAIFRRMAPSSLAAFKYLVRVPIDEFDAALQRRHVRPMDFTGKPLKGFVYVSAPGFATAASRRGWLTQGERAARNATPGRSGRRPRLNKS
jgi:hypothetical protein